MAWFLVGFFATLMVLFAMSAGRSAAKFHAAQIEIGRIQARCGSAELQLMVMQKALKDQKAATDYYHRMANTMAGGGLGMDKQLLDRLIRLCHPDKHAGSKLANEVTQQLLSMRK